jgi:peptidoglycan/LPS O-acetylase OafA/YrhL
MVNVISSLVKYKNLNKTDSKRQKPLDAMRSLLIDILRSLGIALLLFGHLYAKLHNEFLYNSWMSQNSYLILPGNPAVLIFLFLSGLSLQIQYGSKTYHYGKFLVKRFLRIYSIYYMSLIIGITVFIYIGYQKNGSVFSRLSSLNFSDLILSLTGFYAFFGKWGGPFVKTSWFIGLIVTLYFAFPFLSKCIKKNPHLWILLLFLISVISRFIITEYTDSSDRFIRWFPLCRIFEFSFGIYLATVAKPSLWYVLNNKSSVLEKTFEFIGKLSFPLFLIHMPFIYFVGELKIKGYTDFTIVILFLAVTITLSWFVLKLDEHVPRKKILQLFSKLSRSLASL